MNMTQVSIAAGVDAANYDEQDGRRAQPKGREPLRVDVRKIWKNTQPCQATE